MSREPSRKKKIMFREFHLKSIRKYTFLNNIRNLISFPSLHKKII